MGWPFLKFGAQPPVCLIGRYRIVGDPLLACVLIEVDTMVKAAINLSDIEMIERRDGSRMRRLCRL